MSIILHAAFTAWICTLVLFFLSTYVELTALNQKGITYYKSQ